MGDSLVNHWLSGQRPLTLLWVVAAVLVLLTISFGLILRRGNESMRIMIAQQLRSVMISHANSVKLHLEDLTDEAERLARFPSIHKICRSLSTASTPIESAPPSELADHTRDSLDEIILSRRGVDGWLVTDSRGLVLASNLADWRGQRIDLPFSAQKRFQSQQPSIVVPSKLDSHPSSKRLYALAPVYENLRLLALVGWVIDPADKLSQIATAGPASRSDDTYLFDRDARMLTESRFTDQIRQVGLLDSNDQSSAVFTLSLRDPGRNLLDAGKPLKGKLNSRPLTLMADQATRGGKGINVTGYRDYRGVPVVGAWQWLDPFDLGIATEMDVEEAYLPLAVLQRMFYLLAALLMVATVLALGLAVLAAYLSRRRTPIIEEGPRQLGQYELTELLGVGGMGSVYRGRHDLLRRDVAIKVLEGSDLSAAAITRFQREVQLTSTLRHPNTIAIYDYGQAETESTTKNQSDPPRTWYYVMEYVDGISLQQLIDYYGAQPPDRVIHLLLQVCGSLGEAHQAGLIHRDIKPANILLSADAGSWDHIKVLDFGLVKEIEKSSETIAVTLTRDDAITGTPLYMAPETIRDAKQASIAGDIYSIGAVGYALLTGKPTYEGQSAIDLCVQQLEKPPVPPSERLGRLIPQGLEDVIMSCLSMEARQRPQSAAALTEQLESLPESTHWTQIQSALWWNEVFEKPTGPADHRADNPTRAD